jgi:ABC-type sulfate transport system permease subunit
MYTHKNIYIYIYIYVGMDLFIGKPFIMKELQPLLEQLCMSKNDHICSTTLFQTALLEQSAKDT